MTLFRDVELGGARLIVLADLVLADGDVAGDVVGAHAHQGDRAVFRRLVAGGVLLEVFRQDLVVRLADVGDAAVGDQDRRGDALLRPVAVDRIDQRLGHRDAGGDRVEQLVADEAEALVGDEGRLAHLLLLEIGLEARRIELPELVLEGGVLDDHLLDHGIGHHQVQALGLDIEEGVADHLVEHDLRQAELARQIIVQLAAEARLQAIHLVVEFLHELRPGDPHRADLGHGRLAAALAQHVADAPDPERADQDEEQDLDDPGRGFAAERGQHGAISSDKGWRSARGLRETAGIIGTTSRSGNSNARRRRCSGGVGPCY